MTVERGIGRELFIIPATIRTYVGHAMLKQVTTIAQSVVIAVQTGLTVAPSLTRVPRLRRRT